MNILFMAKETDSSIIALKHMCSKKKHQIIAVIQESATKLNSICKENNIPIKTEDEIKKEILNEGLEIDYLLSFYWKRVKKDLLLLPKKGSINFHPGPLPEARGSGYHISILEDWGYWGVTAHYMEEEFDTGEIIVRKDFSLPKDITNIELVDKTHEELGKLFIEIFGDLERGVILKSRSQGEGRYFSIREIEKDKQIKDTDSIEDIDRKIRAFWHPPYHGAQIEIGGKKYTLVSEEILKKL